MNKYHEKSEALSLSYEGDICIKNKVRVPQMCQLVQELWVGRNAQPDPSSLQLSAS